MSAETDIAAIDDGGANTAAEVRTALTSILGRADSFADAFLAPKGHSTNERRSINLAQSQAAAVSPIPDILLLSGSQTVGADRAIEPPSGGATSPLSTKGDLWGYDTDDNRIPIGSDGQVLTVDSAQALGLKWATPSGGGGGAAGGSIYDPVFAPPTSPNSEDEEWEDENGSGVPSGWTASGGTGFGTVSWVESGGFLAVHHTGALPTQGASFGVTKALPASPTAPWTIETAVRFGPHLKDYNMVGLVITDNQSYGSGTQAICHTNFDSGSGMSWGMHQWSNWNTRTLKNSSGPFTGMLVGGWIFLRLVWVSSNTWRGLWSIDGVTWVRIPSDQADASITMTPTHWGLWASGWNSSTDDNTFTYAYFRAYQSAKDAGVDHMARTPVGGGGESFHPYLLIGA